MMKKKLCGGEKNQVFGIGAVSSALLIGALLTPAPADAGNGNVYFSGIIGPRNFCHIIIQYDGDITANGTMDTLSTANAGGRPAKVTINATNGSYQTSFDISASNPISFHTAPAGGNTGVTFQTTYSGTGATNFGPIPGTQSRKLSKGTTEVEIGLTASRADTFPEGEYASTIVILCE